MGTGKSHAKPGRALGQCYTIVSANDEERKMT